MLILHLESFVFLCYNSIINYTKLFRINKTKVLFKDLRKSSNSIYYATLIILILSLKYNFQFNCTTLFWIILFFSKLDNILEKSFNFLDNGFIFIILPSFVIFFIFLGFIKSFLVFLFFVELYSILYYFFFLASHKFTNQTILKYKNSLLLLLWNNFLTTIFMSLGCFFMFSYLGSTQFREIELLNTCVIGIELFIIGLCWKLGLPLFHFFKVEVYKYLSKENLFLFSIITTLINVVIMYSLLLQPSLFMFVYNYNWFVLSLTVSINLVILNLKINNFSFFIALSGILTVLTSLIIFLF